jgi:hypothetical protein
MCSAHLSGRLVRGGLEAPCDSELHSGEKLCRHVSLSEHDGQRLLLGTVAQLEGEELELKDDS